jgi:hypothetical protein
VGSVNPHQNQHQHQPQVEAHQKYLYWYLKSKISGVKKSKTKEASHHHPSVTGIYYT